MNTAIKPQFTNNDEFFKMQELSDVTLEYFNGQIYAQAQPSSSHQLVQGNLGGILYMYFKEKQCKVYPAGLLVTLHDENSIYNLVPDLSVICEQSKMTDKSYDGAPALVIEILSPSNQSHDFIRKLDVYMRCGVKEYWIVNPWNKTAQIFNFNCGEIVGDIVYRADEILISKVFENLTINLKDIFGSK